MKFKEWLQKEGLGGLGGQTSMDKAPDQEELAKVLYDDGKGGGAFPTYSTKDLPPIPKKCKTRKRLGMSK